MATAAVCHHSPPVFKEAHLRGASSRWNGCGSNSARNSLIRALESDKP